MSEPRTLAARRRWSASIGLIAVAAAVVTVVTVVTGIAAAPRAHAAPAAVSGNLMGTPSFEYRVWPWSGTNLRRVARADAVNGNWVARVSANSGTLMLDAYPGRLVGAGTTYTASASLAAGSAASLGAPVTLVLREHTPAGAWVASAQQTATLRPSFVRVAVSLTTRHAGDRVDVYAYQAHAQTGSAFDLDAVSLTMPVAAAAPAPVAQPGASGPSTLGLLAIDSGQADHLGDTSRYAYVVLQASQWSHVAAIKRANPQTKVLSYMEAAATQLKTCSGGYPWRHTPDDSFGLNYCWAKKYLPGLFLKDRNGRDLAAVDYSRSITMDVGDWRYARAWAVGVQYSTHSHGFDGVYLDDVNVDPGHGLNGRFAKYSDEAYGRATVAFADRVGYYLRARGMLAIANVGMSPWVDWQLRDTLDMAPHLSAVNREHYSRYGDICGPFGEVFNTTATNGTPPMDIMLRYEQQVQAAGAHITGVDYGYSNSTWTDLGVMAYGRAQFLLAWDGKAGSAYFFRRCSAVDTAAPSWMADLGLPAGPVTVTASGALVRPYTKGMVVLNPQRYGTVSVALPPGMRTVAGAKVSTSVQVPAKRAALLMH